MKVLVIGGGGREHAIIKKLKESNRIEKLFAAPGNAGISRYAECVSIKATDLVKMPEFALAKGIDYCVVAPDDPLVLGMVDAMEGVGIPCFGPDKAAAILEGSKVFSKNLMKKYNIPTADYQSFDNAPEAIAYIKEKNSYPAVIKADGLAFGKGVIIAADFLEAEKSICSMLDDKEFGESGSNIVVEEFLTGPEVSVLSFCDGKTIIPMVSAMDHKRAQDGDKGLNTGGMGTIAPNPYYTEEIAKLCMDTIFIPTMEAMNREGRPFKGCIFFGLMLTKSGPRVIEYNCRFGDPETQVVLPLLKTDLLDIFEACTNQTLSEISVSFETGSAACVILASGGYPQKYETGKAISGLNDEGGLTVEDESTAVYHSGTRLEDGRFLTNGGRVLGICHKASTLGDAIKGAYSAAENISFEGCYKRMDIGKSGLLK